MKVFVIGAHGQIGKQVVEKLSAHGHEVLAGIRDMSQASDFNLPNVKPVDFDLNEQPAEMAQKFIGISAIVFTAGSGGSTGADKTLLIDLDGAVKSMQAAEIAGVKRFVLVSAIFADSREDWPEALKPYYVAKFYADQWLLRETDLNYTILQPGTLTNDAGTGKVNLRPDGRGTIPREDVASLIVASLENSHASEQVITAVSGDTEIKDAINAL